MDPFLLGLSFLSGLLTVLAPCVLPVLPVIIGSSATSQDRSRPLIVTLSLVISIIAFTLLLKVSSLLIMVPEMFWMSASGGIILIFGLTMLFPQQWEVISIKLGFGSESQKLLAGASEKKSVLGSILIGAALGPVFASCSPTYLLILATVLPVNLLVGIVYLIAYGIGLAIVLGLIAYFGQRLVIKLGWLSNPYGLFKRIMGVLLILVGLSIVTGIEKSIEVAILDAGFGVTTIETQLLDMMDEKKNKPKQSSETVESVLPVLYKAPELTGVANWINSEPINSMEELKGKVVLIDFWTYSCVNCIRTLPFLQTWHERYEDDGLIIIGVHAPEFQFEKILDNVKKAIKNYGLTYAVVQDNDFNLWRSYNNRFWPAKYLIDQNGNVRYTHFGEGKYEETEQAIVYLLNTTMEEGKIEAESVDFGKIKTPEIYIGTQRRQNYVEPDRELDKNEWTLTGEWKEEKENATNKSQRASIKINFTANKANLVIDGEGTAEVIIDGEPATNQNSGEDVKDGILIINGARLYELTDFKGIAGTHEIEIIFEEPGIELFAWTFG